MYFNGTGIWGGETISKQYTIYFLQMYLYHKLCDVIDQMYLHVYTINYVT